MQSWSLKDAHDEPLSMVRLFDVAGGGGGGGANRSSSLIASGDEGGGLKIWDVRAKKQVRIFWIEFCEFLLTNMCLLVGASQ